LLLPNLIFAKSYVGIEGAWSKLKTEVNARHNLKRAMPDGASSLKGSYEYVTDDKWGIQASYERTFRETIDFTVPANSNFLLQNNLTQKNVSVASYVKGPALSLMGYENFMRTNHLVGQTTLAFLKVKPQISNHDKIKSSYSFVPKLGLGLQREFLKHLTVRFMLRYEFTQNLKLSFKNDDAKYESIKPFEDAASFSLGFFYRF